VLSSIHDVKKKNEKRLLAMKGVVSVGIGQDKEGKPLIVVGLDSPQAQTVVKLPKELEGFPVRVEVIGPVKAL